MTIEHDPRVGGRVRPRVVWYLIPLLVVLIGIAAGAALYTSAVGPLGGAFRRFSTGQSIMLSMRQGERLTIYTVTQFNLLNCRPGAMSDVVIEGATPGLRGAVDGGTWYARWTVHAFRSGRFPLTCLPGPGAAATTVAVGPYRSLGTAELELGAAAVSLGLGLLAAAITAVVIAVSRGSSRRRLRHLGGPAGGPV